MPIACGICSGYSPDALVDVDEIQPAGLVTDADLPGSRIADLHVDDAELLRPARGLDDRGFGHGVPPHSRWLQA
jgi:hypothetical protein